MLRRKSSIDQLPQESREKLDAMLADPFNGLTYKDILAVVEEDCGVALSYSALQRYAKKYNRERDRLTFANQELQGIRALLEQQTPADVSAQLLALIQYGLLRRVADGQDDFGDLTLPEAVKMTLQALRASTSVYRYRDQTLERCVADGDMMAAAHMDWLRQELRKNPALLKELTADTESAKEGSDEDG